MSYIGCPKLNDNFVSGLRLCKKAVGAQGWPVFTISLRLNTDFCLRPRAPGVSCASTLIFLAPGRAPCTRILAPYFEEFWKNRNCTKYPNYRARPCASVSFQEALTAYCEEREIDLFAGASPKPQNPKTSDSLEILESEIVEIKDRDLKKLFKMIALICHPDKLLGLSEEEQKEKTELFIKVRRFL